ncbi:MAG TPA: hypothetical protein VFB03_00325 [Candidatus Saccharimonadales bacterium]|nr:hypothetical protein [Candidatus Saccharimonadales bacterium]
MMKLKEAIKNSPGNVVRDPYGSAYLIASAGSVMPLFMENLGIAGEVGLPVAAAALVYSGVNHIAKMSRLRNRLSRSLSRHGFDTREFIQTVPSICSRQAARTVCREAGLRDEYDALVDTCLQRPRRTKHLLR